VLPLPVSTRDRATLTVEKTGADGAVVTEPVRMVREDGSWKVGFDVEAGPEPTPAAPGKKGKGSRGLKGAIDRG
jgi:hypothetical protein